MPRPASVVAARMFKEEAVDHHRFDDLTKTLAGGASRRGALRALAGGAAGALALLVGPPAAAKPTTSKKSECCPPEAPLLCGGLSCVECCADTDCGDGSVCLANGTCATPCNGGDDCGTAGCAGNRCITTDEESVCSAGGQGQECSTNAECPVGQACSGAFCEAVC